MSTRQNGAAIRVIRERDGRTQRDLADAVGCTQAAIHAWESEKHEASWRALHRVARALCVPTRAIVRVDVEPPEVTLDDDASESELPETATA